MKPTRASVDLQIMKLMVLVATCFILSMVISMIASLLSPRVWSIQFHWIILFHSFYSKHVQLQYHTSNVSNYFWINNNTSRYISIYYSLIKNHYYTYHLSKQFSHIFFRLSSKCNLMIVDFIQRQNIVAFYVSTYT